MPILHNNMILDFEQKVRDLQYEHYTSYDLNALILMMSIEQYHRLRSWLVHVTLRRTKEQLPNFLDLFPLHQQDVNSCIEVVELWHTGVISPEDLDTCHTQLALMVNQAASVFWQSPAQDTHYVKAYESISMLWRALDICTWERSKGFPGLTKRLISNKNLLRAAYIILSASA